MGGDRIDDEQDRALVTLDTTESRSLALDAARAAEEKLATDISVLHVGAVLGIAEYFVIVSTRNPRQLDTVVDEIGRVLKRDGRMPLRREGAKDDGWMVLDYGDVVVHVFDERQRAHYDLERLWSDAPRVELSTAGR